VVAANPNYRFPPAPPNSVPPAKRLAERVRHYFDRHPEVSREEFLLDAVRRELNSREHEEAGTGPWPGRPGGPGTSPWTGRRPRRSAEDARIHAWLNVRLAALRRERRGLWPRVRRFFLGNRLVRWLASGSW
jgi:hypothetical protein